MFLIYLPLLVRRNCSTHRGTFDVMLEGGKSSIPPCTILDLPQGHFWSKNSSGCKQQKPKLNYLEKPPRNYIARVAQTQEKHGFNWPSKITGTRTLPGFFPANSHQCFSLCQFSILLETATFFPEWAFDIPSPHREMNYFSKSHLKSPRKGPKCQPPSYEQKDQFYTWQPPREQYSLSEEKSRSSKRRTVLFFVFEFIYLFIFIVVKL